MVIQLQVDPKNGEQLLKHGPWDCVMFAEIIQSMYVVIMTVVHEKQIATLPKTEHESDQEEQPTES